MTIKHTPYTPSSIVAEKLKFRVPLYQRPYAWESDQVQVLLNDLFSAFQSAQESCYYIGILSIAKTIDDSSRFDLIDGQQRITTLTLIGKAASQYHGSWKEFLTSDRLDLYGREGDKAFLDGDKVFLEKGKKLEFNQRMKVTLENAKAFFEDKFKMKDGKEQFSRFIYERAALFLAEVPPSYSLMDKNRQFVRMNNRGKQLEKHEILKVKLLNSESINEEQDRKNFFKTWSEMVDCLTGSGVRTDDSQYRLIDILNKKNDSTSDSDKEILYTSIVTIPEFLLIALARYRENVKVSHEKDKLLETFISGSETRLNNSDEIKYFMGVIEKQLFILKKYFVFRVKNENYKLTNDEDKTFIPEESKDKNKAHLIAIQSYLYISTEPHHWLIPAFKWCQKMIDKYGTIKAQKFIKQLEIIDNALLKEERNLGTFPTLDKMTYENRVNHYWFYRLDYELWKLSQKKEKPSKVEEKPKIGNIWEEFRMKADDNGILNLLKDFQFRRCGSIEHIKPQKSQAVDNESDHRFGNLALISSSRNSKFSNNPPDGKKESIIESKYTESLKMLHFLYSDKDVEKQGELMYKILSIGLKGRHNRPAAILRLSKRILKTRKSHSAPRRRAQR